jgi:hypothetical protein
MIAPAAADPRGRVLFACVGNLRGDDGFALTVPAPFQGRLPTGADRIETDIGGLGGRDVVDLRLLGPDPWAPTLLLDLRLTVCRAGAARRRELSGVATPLEAAIVGAPR